MLKNSCCELMTIAWPFLVKALPQFGVDCEPCAGMGFPGWPRLPAFHMELHAIATNEPPV
jgi:hypothetical protein